MRLGKILTFICMILMSTSLVVQAAEVDEANAVASVTLADETQVLYYDSIQDAVNKAAENEDSTVQLLSSISLEQTILITSGYFTFDLNGKRVECYEPGDTAVLISGGTVCLKDSSSGQTGTIEGTATGVDVKGSANVSIESGNYQSNTWGIMTSADNLSTSKPTLELKGGNFRGSVAVSHGYGELTISGGEYHSSGQAVFNVSDKADVRGGTFYGQIEVFFTGVLDFRDGKLIVQDYSETSATPTVYGINNSGTLNLFGGTIVANADEDNPVCGIKNQTLDETAEKLAELHLLGDITFDENLCADFYLREPIMIGYALQNCYRILWMKAYEDETTIFATAGDGITLSRDNFVLDKKGYLVALSEDQSSLTVSKCDHPEIDDQSICKACGILIQARIGNQYFEFAEDALNAVTDNQTVVLLADIEGLSIGSGTFSLDLNGYAIRNSLSIQGGKIVLKGKGTAVSEYIEHLYIHPGAHVEIQDVAVKGTDRAVTNLGGTLILKSGEINAGKIAILNLGGTVTVGEEGAGPVIKAPTGIVNSKLATAEMNLDAVLCIYGGSLIAETDIYNQTGAYPYEDEFLSEVPLTAGDIKLKGGTFVDGLYVMLDEGLDLTDIMEEGYGYFGSDGREIPVETGTLQLNQTVMVAIPAKVGDISTSGNSETTYGQSCTIGVTTQEDRETYDYTYQWYDASGAIHGATSAEYTVPAGRPAGEYTYFCRVTATRKDNGLSESKDSAAIRVTIEKAPEPDDGGSTKPDGPADEGTTPTPDPGETPEPTPTPDPGETPEPTPTPDPGETPDPTPTPDSGETPDPTPTPDPGETPESTPTPDSGETPDPTPTPDPEVPAVHAHLYKQYVIKATTQASGKIVMKCDCGKVKRTTTIKKIKTVKLSQGKFTYNGKKKAPYVIVKDSSGKKLVKGKDYTVTVPAGRKNVGVYTYKITFKGNYQGTKTLKLTIQPKATTVQSVKPAKKTVTVKWKKAAKTQTTGYQVMLATNKSFTKNKKSLTIKGYKNTSKKVTKLKTKTKYYVKVRTYKTVKVNGKNTKLYSNWTKVRTVQTK